MILPEPLPPKERYTLVVVRQDTQQAARAQVEDRPCARVLVLDPEARVLLMQYRHPRGGTLWTLPGGGLEGAETHEEAAQREFFEETGQRAGELGPWIWNREHLYEWEGRRIHARERVYLLRSDPFEIDLSNAQELELRYLIGWRWWTRDEIEAATEERFVPRRLGALLAPIVEGRLPASPVDTGV